MPNTLDVQRLMELVDEFEEADDRALEAARIAITPATWNAETWQAVAEAFKEALTAKNRVRDHLLGHPQVRAQGGLRQKLRNIRKNSGYAIDLLATLLQADQTQLTEDDIDELQDDFYLYLDSEEDEESFRRSRRIGPVLSTHTLPARVIENLEQVRRCFVIGLYPAAVIFCRAMVEAALFRAAESRGLLQSGRGTHGNTTDLAEWKLSELKHRARALRIPAAVWDPVFGDNQRAVGRLADRLLHSKREDVLVSENDALRCIEASNEMLEALFSS